MTNTTRLMTRRAAIGQPTTTRRTVLATGGVALLSTPSLLGCDALSTDPDTQDDDVGAVDVDQKQAPMLEKQVEAGDLPPLEERLPAEPLVVEPTERLGTYGGQWRAALIGTTPFWLIRSIGYENLVRWNLGFDDIVPNIARDIEVADDGTQYTFHLREGMRWSDGEPFTVDDIVFWYESVATDPDVSPGGLPLWLSSNGEPMRLEAIDELTFRVSFARSNGLFLHRLATPDGALITRCPRHYLEQFHAKHNPDADKLANDEGYADWVELFNGRGVGDAFWTVADVPTLLPWRITTPIGEGQRVIAERNPYYWKTDPEGRQLPYLDGVVNEIVNEADVLILKTLNGEIDMRSRDVAVLSNKPVLADGREDGDYRFFDQVPTYMNKALVAFNLNHQDPVKREIFQNVDFRIGLSHAIDRQELIDTVYQRQGEPWQVAPREDSPYFHEKLASQYLEFDLDAANEYLDRAGYAERDGDGFRLGPDGQRITFNLEAVDELRPEMSEVGQWLHESWQQVGIDARVRAQSRDLYINREQSNEFDVTIWIGDAGGQDAILDPRWYFPYSGASVFARMWGMWRTSDGADGEEPPEPVKKQIELYEELAGTLEEDERVELMQQILDISAEEFYLIGTVKDPVGYGIVKNDFHNVADPMFDSWMYPDPGPTNPEQYFVE